MARFRVVKERIQFHFYPRGYDGSSVQADHLDDPTSLGDDIGPFGWFFITLW